MRDYERNGQRPRYEIRLISISNESYVSILQKPVTDGFVTHATPACASRTHSFRRKTRAFPANAMIAFDSLIKQDVPLGAPASLFFLHSVFFLAGHATPRTLSA